jgi:hypothetical protein
MRPRVRVGTNWCIDATAIGLNHAAEGLQYRSS